VAVSPRRLAALRNECTLGARYGGWAAEHRRETTCQRTIRAGGEQNGGRPAWWRSA
jgi:hypothetical protein